MKTKFLNKSYWLTSQLHCLGSPSYFRPAFQRGAKNNEQPVDDFKPSSLNQPNKQFPQVNAEGRGAHLRCCSAGNERFARYWRREIPAF